MSLKSERVASNMEREISYILATEIKDQEIAKATITACKVTSDLGFAKVYFTILDESKKREVEKALNTAKGFIRRQLAERMEIRHIPELQFVYDDSIHYGSKIEHIIDHLHDNKKLDDPS